MSEQQRARRRRRRRERRQQRREEAPEVDAGAEAAEAEAEAAEAPSRRERGRRPVREERRPQATFFGMPRFVFAMTAGLFVALLLVIILQQVVDPQEDLAGVERVPDQGRRHLAAEETFRDYNSTPATSGPQDPAGVPPGIYGPDEPAPFDFVPADRQLLPVLEAGGIVIHYDPARLTDAAVASLRARFETWRSAGADRLVLVANPAIDAPIVATAWAHLFSIEEPDEDEDFIGELDAFLLADEERYYGRFVLETNPQTVDLAAATQIEAADDENQTE